MSLRSLPPGLSHWALTSPILAGDPCSRQASSLIRGGRPQAPGLAPRGFSALFGWTAFPCSTTVCELTCHWRRGSRRLSRSVAPAGSRGTQEAPDGGRGAAGARARQVPLFPGALLQLARPLRGPRSWPPAGSKAPAVCSDTLSLPVGPPRPPPPVPSCCACPKQFPGLWEMYTLRC